MSEIDALLQEDRSFPPSPEFQRAALSSTIPASTSARRTDPEAFWAGFAGELEWIEPWNEVLRWKPPHAKWFVGGKLNASANCLDRHVRTARRNKAALIWEGEPGDRRTLTYWDLYRAGRQVRERPEVARREEGRPRRALPAADPGARHRDARLRPHRRGPQRRVRRLQRRVAARPHQRRAGGPARHRRRRLPARPGRAAQADGRRGARARRRRSRTSSSCSARPAIAHPGRDEERAATTGITT